MYSKPLSLIVAGLAAAILMSAPVFAAKVSLNDEAIAEVSGSANDTTFGGDSNATISAAGGASANSQLPSDQSQNYAASNQSGSDSRVQQNINGLNNALSVGAVSQNTVINSGGTVVGSLSVVGYALIARRDF